MENSFEIDLIDGTFTSLETSKVLFSLLNSKINYHNLEIFSAQIRNDENIDNSKKRVAKLNEAANMLDKIIKQAVEQGKKFEISSTISIKVIDNE